MNYKHAAGSIALAAFLFAVPASAQEAVKGTFYADCFPSDGPAVTIELENYMRLTLYGKDVESDDVYRTKAQVMPDEGETLYVGMCTEKIGDCKFVEGVLSTYKTDDEMIEATLEYFDGTETQGDSESIQGHMVSFTATRDHDRPSPACL